MGPRIPGLIEYRNMPGVIAALVSSRLATLAELQSHYGVEDAYDMLEVLTVDACNQKIARDHFESEARRNGNRR
jgi:hypothetical protein